MEGKNREKSILFKELNHKRNLALHGISYSELKSLAIKITKNSFDQKDIIQEMYICLLKSPKGMNKSWYKQRCYYRGIDYLRRNNHHISLEEYYYKDRRRNNGYFEIYNKWKHEYKLKLIKERAYQILNSKEFSIFKYYFIEGFRQKEIAQNLHLTRACVAKKIQRICHKIRNSFVVYNKNLIKV